MNDEQRKLFIGAASMGVACGLTHRYEWYINAIRALGHGPYVDIADGAQKLREAFHAFEQTTASCPEEDAELKAMTLDDFDKKVDAYYRAARAKANGP